jgi:hypothetical protein
VIITLVPERVAADLNPIFGPMLAASAEIMADYSEEGLATVLDFIRRAGPMLAAQTKALRDGASDDRRSKPSAIVGE